MDNMVIFWLVFFIIAIAIEVMTLGLTSIWFAGGALIALVLSMFNLPVVFQVIVFIAVSLALLIFTRPIAVRYFNKDRLKTNVETLIGKQAIVINEIDNLQGIGQVTVGGQEWSARSADDKKQFAVGEVVEVVAVNGVKLIVKHGMR